MPYGEPITEQDLEPLTKIFFIDKMKDLKKHCRDATIDRSVFAQFVLACQAGILPWRHRISYRDFVPEDVRPTDADLHALPTNGVGRLSKEASRTVRKFSTLIQVRRYLVGHIFYSDDAADWHFFYFDQRDINDDKNHWIGGSHIHLINHLWPNQTAQQVWDHFRSGNVQMRGSLHIRFRDGQT